MLSHDLQLLALKVPPLGTGAPNFNNLHQLLLRMGFMLDRKRTDANHGLSYYFYHAEKDVNNEAFVISIPRNFVLSNVTKYDDHRGNPRIKYNYTNTQSSVQIEATARKTHNGGNLITELIVTLHGQKVNASDRTTRRIADFSEAIQRQAVKLFTELAQAQRGLPERMAVSRKANPGLYNAMGLFTWSAEHIGDLTHRMTEMAKWGDFGWQAMAEKINKALRNFRQPYGFAREIENNLKNNFEADGAKNFTEYKEAFTQAALLYSTAHSHLTVWNEAQWHARQAAVELGKLNYAQSERHVGSLSLHLQPIEDWNNWASQITVEGDKIIPYRRSRLLTTAHSKNI